MNRSKKLSVGKAERLLSVCLIFLILQPSLLVENARAEANRISDRAEQTVQAMRKQMDELKILSDSQLRAAWQSEPKKYTQLLELMLEDALFARVLQLQPAFPAALLDRLAALSPGPERQILALLRSEPDSVKLLLRIQALKPTGAFTYLLSELQALQRSLPPEESLKADKVFTAVFKIQGQSEPALPALYYAYLTLSDAEPRELAGFAKSLIAQAESLGHPSLGLLVTLRQIRLLVPAKISAELRQQLDQAAKNSALPARLQAEALITQGQILYPMDAQAARASWQAAVKLIEAQSPNHLLRVMLAFAYAQAGETALARSLYLQLAQDRTNPFRARVLQALLELEEPELIQEPGLPVDDADPGVRAISARFLVQLVEPADALPKLRQLLQDADPSVRRASLDALAGAKPELITALLPALEPFIAGGEADLRWMALWLLNNAPSAEAEKMILTQLKTSKPEWQISLLDALGRLHRPQSAEAVLPFLQSPELELRRSAVRALASLGNPIALPALRQLKPDAALAADVQIALMRLGDSQSAEGLIPLLTNPVSSSEVSQQLYALLKTGKLDLKQLQAWLQGSRPELKVALWNWLQSVNWPQPLELVPDLALALADQAKVQQSALGVLRKYPQLFSPLSPQVQRLLGSPNQQLRLDSLSLMLEHHKLSEADLSSLLKDANQAIRIKALELLNRLHPERFRSRVAKLVEAFDPQADNAPTTQFRELLASLSQSDLAGLIRPQLTRKALRDWLIESLWHNDIKIPASLLPELLPMLTSEQMEQTLLSLTGEPDSAVTPLVVHLLAHPEPRIRAVVLSLLAQSGQAELAPQLEPLLQDRALVMASRLNRLQLDYVRRMMREDSGKSLPIALIAFDALNHLNPGGNKKYLGTLLNVPDREIRAQAALAISFTLSDHQAQWALLEPLLKDPDQKVKANAEKGLSELLRQTYDGPLKQELLKHLPFSHLLEQLKSPQAVLRLAALEALSHYPDRAILDAVLPFAERGSEAEQAAAIQALAQLKAPELTPLFLSKLHQPHEENSWNSIFASAVQALEPLMDEPLWQRIYQEVLSPSSDSFETDRFLFNLLKKPKNPKHLLALFRLAEMRPELMKSSYSPYSQLADLAMDQTDLTQLAYLREQLQQNQPVRKLLALACLHALTREHRLLGDQLLEEVMPNLQASDANLKQLAELWLVKFGSIAQIEASLPALLGSELSYSLLNALQDRPLLKLVPALRRLLPQTPADAQVQIVSLLVKWLGKDSLPDVLAELDRLKTIRSEKYKRIERQRQMLDLLAQVGSEAQVPLLKGFLADPDLAPAARSSLIKLGDQSQNQAVLRLLRSKGRVEKTQGILMAYSLRDIQIQQELLRLLDDRSEADSDDEPYRIDEGAVAALRATILPEMVPLLLKKYSHADATTKEHLAEILDAATYTDDEFFKGHSQVLDQLLPLLNSPDSEVVKYSVALIALFKEAKAISPLAVLLQSSDTDLQQMVLGAFAEIDSPAALPYLKAFRPKAPQSMLNLVDSLIQQFQKR